MFAPLLETPNASKYVVVADTCTLPKDSQRLAFHKKALPVHPSQGILLFL